MIKLKKITVVKFLALLLVILFIQGDLSVFCANESYQDRFLQARAEYVSGRFTAAIDILERIHRIGLLKGDLGETDKEFLSRVHLLLGAAYEQNDNVTEARDNYELAKKYAASPVVEGIDFEGLVEYQRIILNKDIPPRIVSKNVIEKSAVKKRKKFPWLLVAGGSIALAVILVLILKKKNGGSGIDPNYDTQTLGFEWVSIPAGQFQMGDNFNEGLENEWPVHTVTLDEYRISKYEVTFAQYDAFCQDTNRVLPDDKGWGRDNMPVFYVTWYDAEAFCNWLSEKTGKNIHLPTEAQWEKAARGTDQRRYPWGNSTPDCELTNFTGCAGQTLPVGTHPQGGSFYGVHDMAGNVSEFVNDWYAGNYYSTSPADNPQGPEEGVLKVHRGASWINSAYSLRSSSRFAHDPLEKASYIGFRICWEVNQ
jgi:formylglycine-generating enzyme required for sulfatase activity